MSDDKTVEIRITAKNVTDQAFQKVTSSLKALEGQAGATGAKGAAAFDGIGTKLQGMSGLTGAVGASFTKLFGAFSAANIATAALGGLTESLQDFAKVGMKLGAVEQSFGRLASSAKVNSVLMLDAMTEGTRGLVSQFDLMKSANQAMLLGLPTTTESMGELAKTATVLGRAVGKDATESLDKLILALGRSSPPLLDDLGIKVKLSEANAAHAASLKKTTDQLTEAERQTAFYNAAMEAARVKTRELGEQTKTLGEIAATTWTSFGNVVSRTVSAVNEGSVAAVSTWGKYIQAIKDSGGAQGVFGALVLAQLRQQADTIKNMPKPDVSPPAASTAAAKGAIELLREMEAKVRALNAAQKQEIDAARQLGGDVLETVLKKYKLGAEALRLMDTASRQYTATARAATKEISAHERAVTDLADRLGGKGAKREADLLAEALTRLGGAHNLTSVGAQQVHEQLGDLLQVYRDLGERAPEWIVDVWGATLPPMEVISGVSHLEAELKKLQVTMTSLPTIGVTEGLGGLPLPGQVLPLPTAPKGPGIFAGFGDAITKQLGPTILGALQGGGDVAKSAGGLLGGTLAKGVANSLGSKLGSTLGATLGSVIPGLGTLLGGMAGGALGKFFGGIFGDSKEQKEQKAATAEVTKLAEELTKAHGSMANLRELGKLTGIDIAAGFGHQGRKGLEAFKGDLASFQQKLAEVKTKFNTDLGGIFNDAQGLGFKLPATMDPYLSKLREMGMITAENERMISGFGADSAISFERMQAAAEKFGISLDALGGAFNTARLSKDTMEILEMLDLMERGGADMAGVLTGASDELSALVQESMKFGTSLPENMRPWIARLMESGQLLDANGDKITDISKLTFGDAIKVGLEKIADRLDTLLKGLGLFKDAIEDIPSRVDVEVNVRRRVTDEGGGGDDTGLPDVGSIVGHDQAANVYRGGLVGSAPTMRRGGDVVIHVHNPSVRDDRDIEALTDRIVRKIPSRLTLAGL